LGDSLQLNAQGIFTRPSKPGQRTYHDVTPPNGGALFFANNGSNQTCTALAYSTANNGVFIGTSTGCCCVAAADGSVRSRSFSVNVNGAPDCDCPQATETATPKGSLGDVDVPATSDNADSDGGNSDDEAPVTPEASP
jgi:hypothetical protein